MAKQNISKQFAGIVEPSWRRWIWEHNGAKSLLRFAAFAIVLLAVLLNDGRVSKYLYLIFQ